MYRRGRGGCAHSRAMKRLLLLPFGIVPFALLLASPATISRAESPTTTCTTYQVDGGIAFGLAEVTMTAAGEPLPGHEVFAVFDDASGVPLGDPTLLVTDADGRATLPMPDTATGVEFVAEAPPADCEGDPDLVSVTRVVPEAAPAADMGTEPAEPVADPGEAVSTPVITAEHPSTDEVTTGAVLIGPESFETSVGPLGLGDFPPVDAPLPHTGRASEMLLSAGFLAVVLGWWIRDWCRRRGCRTGEIRR